MISNFSLGYDCDIKDRIQRSIVDSELWVGITIDSIGFVKYSPV